MNTKEIEKLLGKYEEGMTTLKEEQQLREYFRGTEIPEHLRPYAALFGYFSKAKSEAIPDPRFDQKTDRRLSHPHAHASVTRHVSRVTYFSIAATLLLLIGLFFTLKQDLFRKDGRVQTTAEQEIAMAEVQKALYMVSANLNIGLDQFRRLESFGNAVGQVQKLSKFYQYQPIIINPDNPQDRP